MREAVALLIPGCAIGVLMPPLAVGNGRPSRVSAAALAMCLGIGCSSVTTAALMFVGIAPHGRGFILADAAIWASVAAIGWWRHRGKLGLPGTSPLPVLGVNPLNRVDWIVRAVFGATAIMALATVIASSIAQPHGEWDAWAIWNQHARFLFRGGDQWRAMLEVDWSHPDYPLLLPASVARIWAYAGRETTLGPAMLAMVFGAVSVTLVMAALDLGRRRAWVAGALLLGASAFVLQIPSQCADVPLACFIVATLAVAFGPEGLLAERERPPMAVPLAGAMSTLAAWTKDEGLVFALLMGLLVAIVALRRGTRRQILWWMAGMVPVLAVMAWFKLAVAPASSLFEGQSLGIYAGRLFSLDRHFMVATLMARHLVRWGAPLTASIIPLVGLAAVWLAVVRGGTARRLMLGVVGLMFLAYYTVYLTTPFDVAWHVSTSFDRLLAQLWPPLVLTVFLADRPVHSRIIK